jgi:dTMP kinase
MFITLEGIEGAGKSTAALFLVEFLKQKGIHCVLTREPGGTQLGEILREQLLNYPMHSDTELLLMFAARAEHWQHKIKKNLEQNQWVICDRYIDSSYAYQGAGRGIEIEKISALETIFFKDAQPTLTFLFDLSPEIGLQRAEKRGKLNRFEQETLAFHQRIRESFLNRAKNNKKRFQIIDASLSIEQIQETLKERLSLHL